MSVLYPGHGKQLRKVAASTGNATDSPDVVVIPDGGFSESFGAHDCDNFALHFVLGANGAGATNILVETLIDAGASVAGVTYATIVVAAGERSKHYTPGGPLNGWFRIKNSTGQTLQVWLQKHLNR